MDLEGRADQLVHIIDLGPVQEGQGGFVDDDLGAIPLDQLVVRIHGRIQAERVGEARTPAALDTDPQQRTRRLCGENGVDLFGGRSRKRDIGCHGEPVREFVFGTLPVYGPQHA